MRVLQGEPGVGPKDADDGMWRAVYPNGPAENMRVAA